MFRGYILINPKQRVYITCCIVDRRDGQLCETDQNEAISTTLLPVLGKLKEKEKQRQRASGRLWGKTKSSLVMSLCQRWIPSKPTLTFVSFIWKL